MRVPGVAVVLWLVASLAAAQSLGEAAREQARRRAAGTAPPKVYTNQDLPLRGLPDTAASETVLAGGGEEGKSSLPWPTPPPAGQSSLIPPPPSTGLSPGSAATTDPVRAQLNREEAARKAQEQLWRQRSSAALARIELAQREYDASCGRGALVVTGG